MALSTKSSSKQQVSEKKVKGSRKVEVKVKVAPLEEVKEDEPVLDVSEVKEEVLEDIEPVYQSVTFEVGANACCEPILEVECPPCEEEHEDPITLVKKCAKVRPQIDENGNYLNPLTNRYVKFGSSNFKKLLQQGIIKPVVLDV